jgi:protein-disulfide isomerase
MTSTLRMLSGAALIFSAACSTSAQPARQPVSTDVVARVGDWTITLAEVDERALAQSAGNYSSMRLADALYEARRAAIDDMISIHLVENEAKAQNVAVAALLDREITAKVVAPTELDIAAWYKANPQRVQNAPIDQVREPIRNLLSQERTEDARRRYIDSLKAKATIAVALDAPRVKVEAAGRPTRGPASAPIEIIEFSDFQCPFCLSAFPTVNKVLQTYGDKVRFTYRHYPLPNHPNARPAAEASACAAEQQKFWEYHDRLFQNPTKLAPEELKQHAADLGLNTAAFTACVDGRTFQKDVDTDVAAGNAVGVNGTPAFFINGRPLSGAQPFDVFKRVIDEELARR